MFSCHPFSQLSYDLTTVYIVSFHVFVPLPEIVKTVSWFMKNSEEIRLIFKKILMLVDFRERGEEGKGGERNLHMRGKEPAAQAWAQTGNGVETLQCAGPRPAH